MENKIEIEELVHEIHDIKLRLANLEAIIGERKTADNIRVSPTSIPVPPKSKPSVFNDALLKDGLESLIGKNLLNRVGIIVLLFAVGYFLKYSFDNNWIGPLGRVTIGYTIGIAFLSTGDILMKRGFRYFAQGLSGGGIATIYLSTFAAVNLYHLISPYTAFFLLVLTAVTGGLLAIRQNAFGLAFVATLGGFMAPFLIGSRTGNMTALFTYISILDITVLCLAYYKNWRVLNALAMVGTIAVYIAYHAFSYQSELRYLWIREIFLTIFFLIFSSLSFIYNLRQKLPSKAGETLITLVTAAFFFIASYANLVDRCEHALAWLAVGLALLYLLASRCLIEKNPSDHLLYLTFLGTGLTFVTIAIPLQFDQQWIQTAWLVEAMVLIYAGFQTSTRLVQLAGLSMQMLVTLACIASFPWHGFNTQAPLLNVYSLNAWLAILGLSLAAYLLFTANFFARPRPFLGWAAAIAAVICALYYSSWEIYNALAYFKLSFSYNFSLSLTWVLIAVLVFISGLMRDSKVLRFLALGLFLVTTLKVMLNDLSYMPIVFRIIILTIVGLILLAVSFAYQKAGHSKKEGECD